MLMGSFRGARVCLMLLRRSVDLLTFSDQEKQQGDLQKFRLKVPKLFETIFFSANLRRNRIVLS
jgi:hypothetical protein